MPSDNAVLVEPLAAAVHAVQSLQICEHDRVAVIGPRKLGMLVVAALAAQRRRSGTDFEIMAMARRPELLVLSKMLSADRSLNVGNGCPQSSAEIVIDCTGSAAGFDMALAAATREVHLKSTHGQPAGGIDHLTEFVVDELALEGLSEEALAAVRPATGRDALVVGWASASDPPGWLLGAAEVIRSASVGDLAQALQQDAPGGLAKADVVVVDSPERLIQAIRTSGLVEYSPVRPTGAILYAGPPSPSINLLQQLQQKQLRLSSTRCGDFDAAIELLDSEPALQNLGQRMITHRFAAADLPAAFSAAASRDCIKAVVAHSS